MTKPNILLITTDQQRWDTLSLYNQPGYRTPVLDRLANAGVCYDNAYCPAPVCTPARISILTGQYPSRHGAYEIGMEPVAALELPTLATRLAEAGYDTGLIGKTHFVARTIENRHVAGAGDQAATSEEPSEEFWDSFDGPYVGFEHVHHAIGHTCARAPGGSYRAWLKNKGLNLDELHWANVDGKVDKTKIGPGLWDIDPEHTQTAWITEETIEYINRPRPEGKPWLCWASYQDPHPPFLCPDPWFSQVDMTGVDLGGLREGEMDDKPPFYSRFQQGLGWTDSSEVNHSDGWKPGMNFRYDAAPDPYLCIQAYIGMMNMLDSYVGRVLDALKASGVSDNTLVIFTSDHGEMLGQHGLWEKGIPAYQDTQRIPAIISWPKLQKTAIGRTDAMFNLVDILPTCLDAAEVEIPAGVQGISQLPLLKGEVDTVCDWALIDFHASTKLHQHTLIHGDYKLVVYRDQDYGELYNLKDDPDQYTNLFDIPEAAEIRTRLMHKLVQVHMKSVGKLPTRINTA